MSTQLPPAPLVKLLAGTLRKREQVKKIQFRSLGSEILGRGPQGAQSTLKTSLVLCHSHLEQFLT